MGAGFCSLYPKIHYIEVRYIEIWMYFVSCDSKGSVIKIRFATSDIIGALHFGQSNYVNMTVWMNGPTNVRQCYSMLIFDTDSGKHNIQQNNITK